MLRAILRTTSSKICTTTTTTATPPLYRCRTLCAAVESNNSNSKSELKSAVNTAILDAEQLVKDHERVIKDLTLRATYLKLAMDSPTIDAEQILAELRDLKHLLGVGAVSPSRKECTFPTEVTALLLQRYGGKPSAWVGRYLRVYQMKMLKYQVKPEDVSDRSANHTLARTIVATLVLSLLIIL